MADRLSDTPGVRSMRQRMLAGEFYLADDRS
jgi:hypothetical protein